MAVFRLLVARKAGDPVFEVGAVLGRMNAARDALGLARDFAVDFHGRVSVANAARLLPAAGTVPPALRRGTRAARASRRD
jgi:L-alanine-DL-glutamate epimerase-like enolase superfamily enzyme